MEPVEVVARFDPEGFAKPLKFTWQDRTYPVNSVGRHWRDEDGAHVLLVASDDVYELLFKPADGRWYSSVYFFL